jgi:lipopolysaccharide export LptBFGC system permease protein LptF
MLAFTRRAIALVGVACATGAVAAPRAESALECGIAADMAIVAHSLAREQVQRAKADAIMARIYDVGQSERGQAIMKDILDAAYVPTAAAGGTSSQKFAEDLYATCMQSGGDMDGVLGKKL